MAAVPPPSERRRPRPGSLERPVNGRLYRGTWLLVGLPLLVAAFSVARPAPLPPPTLPPAFDRNAAAGLAIDLSRSYPNRFPGSAGALGAAQWLRDQLSPYGIRTRAEPFSAVVPGHGRLRLQNLLAVVPGRSSATIVVMAHRDDDGSGPGANDNASGTAALVELARAYAAPQGSPARLTPGHTILFLSTDGGAFGGLGAAEFAAHSPERHDVEAVLNLDSIAGRGPVRLQLAGDTPRLPSGTLVETAAARIEDQTGRAPGRPSVLGQLIDLGFPYSLYEQGPFLARGIPALTITTAGDRSPGSVGDTPERIDANRLSQVGRSAQALLGTLDQGLEFATGTSTYAYIGPRLIRGWAVELVLIAALVPFLAAAVDLFARCRRRRIPLAPALRSYRSRLALWLWVGALFGLLKLLGAWPGGAPRPIEPSSGAARDWPLLGLLALLALGFLGWLVARDRLVPRREVSAEEELAGHTATLLCLGGVGLLVVATNPLALLFLLPSLHVWLWLPNVRRGSPWARAIVLTLGLAGPALLLGSFAFRFGLGWDAPWYLAALWAVGYAPFVSLPIGLAWVACTAQLVALATGRYAPYPDVTERRPRGPLRELVRRAILASRARRRATEQGPRALEG